MSELVLITGGSGFIGKALTAKLFKERCRVRIASRFDKPAAQAVEYVKTDYHDPASLAKVLEGVTCVYHLAGTLFAYPKGEYYKTNHEATANLVEACNKANVKRFIMVSSQAAGGPCTEPSCPRSENMKDNPVSHYGKSKLMGEESLKKLNADISWTVFRPGIVYGKGDRGIETFASWVKRGIIVTPSTAKTKFSFVYIDDLVDSLAFALTAKNINREKFYICEPDAYDYKQFMGFLAASLGVKTPLLLSIPKFMAVFGGHVSALISKILRKPPVVSPDKVKEGYAGDWIISSDKWQRFSDKTGWLKLPDGLNKTYK